MSDEHSDRKRLDKDELLGDLTDFWVTDPELRAKVADPEIHRQGIEMRNSIFAIVENPEAHSEKEVAKAMGQLRQLRSKSPKRKKLLKFLEEINNGKKQTQQEQEKKLASSYRLTEAESKAKSEAKELYESGKYFEALTIVENLLRLNPFLEANPGIIGFIMHCYNKLRNPPKTLEFAEKLVKLKDNEPKSWAVAASAAQRTRDEKKALQYAEKGLEFEIDNKVLLGIAALAASRLNQNKKALVYAEASLELSVEIAFLGIAMVAAKNMGLHDKSLNYAKRILIINPHDQVALRIIEQ